MASVATDTQFISVWERKLQAFEDSVLYTIDCANRDLGFRDSSQARKPRLNVHDQSSFRDNFRTAIEALLFCNVVEHSRTDGHNLQ
jgi:hypothetical protein